MSIVPPSVSIVGGRPRDERAEEALSGGATAVRGCSVEGGRRLFLGSSRCAGGLPVRGRKEALSGGRSSCCAGLLGRGREETLSGGAPAARGCSVEGGRRLYSFWNSSGGGSSRWDCPLGTRLFLEELSLRGAARER